MYDRHILQRDALRVLREGQVADRPKVDDRTNDWKCKITKRLVGSKAIGVVTLIVKNDELVIITVEWEYE